MTGIYLYLCLCLVFVVLLWLVQEMFLYDYFKKRCFGLMSLMTFEDLKHNEISFDVKNTACYDENCSRSLV